MEPLHYVWSQVPGKWGEIDEMRTRQLLVPSIKANKSKWGKLRQIVIFLYMWTFADIFRAATCVDFSFERINKPILELVWMKL